MLLLAQSVSPTPLLRGTATPVPNSNITPQRLLMPSPTATAMPVSAASPTPIPEGEQYQLGTAVASEQLPEIALVLRRAQLTATELILTVAFENRSDKPLRFSFITTLDERRIQLLDSNSQRYTVTRMDGDWAAIQPIGGFVAGGANIGTITFARPIGPGPYQLVGIFGYPAIEFDLTTAAPVPIPPIIPNQIYPVGVTLFSSDEVLEPLRIHIESITIAPETMTVDLAIINTHYLSYGLQRGPTGNDAIVLDAERKQYAPLAVSPSLASGFTPEEGILPMEQNRGFITFARPAELASAHIVFPHYSTLLLQFDETGLLSAALAANREGQIPPTPTPQPDIARYHALTALLSQLSTDLLERDQQHFATGFTPALQPVAVERFGRLAQMPLSTVTFTFAPGQSFEAGALSTMSDMSIMLRYTLDGVSPQNDFVQDFAVDFVDEKGSLDQPAWQIAALTPQNTLPFWWTDEVVPHETEHFLIFTRFDASDAINSLRQEMEAAYTTVSEKGLQLEPRYVTYVTDPDENFAEFTGATNPNVLGVALSRYQINQRAIRVIGRAFYINGTNFVDAAQLEQRQSTITHELVHLALVEDARPFTPPWLAEGLAVYYADQPTAADYDAEYNRERIATIDLPTLTRLTSLGVHDTASETTSYRYLYSGAVITYLIEQFGEAQVLAFYRSYAEVPAAEIQDRLPLLSSQPSQDRVFQMMSTEVTETALATYFDLTIEKLDRAVKDWLRGEDTTEH